MEVTVQQGFIQQTEADAIVVNLFEGVQSPGGATGAVDRALDGAVSDLIAGGDFAAELGETAVLYTRGAIPVRRVIIVGLGNSSDFDLEAIREASAAATRRAVKLGIERLATIVHGAGIGGVDPQAAAQATVEGALLAAYTFREFKTEAEDRPDLQRLVIVEASEDKVEAMRQAARVGEIVARAAMLARDLGNRPGNVATPSHLADVARDIAAAAGLRCEILDEDAMRELGMGAVLGVARGSDEPARFIILEHNADRTDQDTIVLVGKGLTFDTGGISLKPHKGLATMKYDMMGGAAVLATMQAVGQLHLQLHVVGLVPATENMPGGAADKPGDVLKALNGKTIEVLNTDAEGRLILADALSYAQRFQPDAVVDLATLTGAAVVALGPYATGLFTNNQALADRVAAAAEAAGERVWPLPLFDEHKKEVVSKVADVRNMGLGRYGGASLGAAVLSNFVGNFPWVHLDIAPTAWVDPQIPYPKPAYVERGATGVGVRLLVRLLQTWA
jgi:leucyl aminopeptidase